MPKKIELKSKVLQIYPSPVDVEYSLEYLRIDGRLVGSRIVPTVVGAQKSLEEDTRNVSINIDDLPQTAQDAYETFANAVLDYACDMADGRNDDLLQVNNPSRYAEKHSEDE